MGNILKEPKLKFVVRCDINVHTLYFNRVTKLINISTTIGEIIGAFTMTWIFLKLKLRPRRLKLYMIDITNLRKKNYAALHLQHFLEMN